VIQHTGPLDFAISCSIDPGLSPGRAVIRATGLKNRGANYHVSNFYPQPDDVPEMLYGSFVQLWSTRHGQGRVLAFTDSTIFANFSIFDPGKSELFLGMLQWLNHGPAFSALAWLLPLLGLALLAGCAFTVRSFRTGSVVLVCGGLLGWVCASHLALVLLRGEMPPLEARLPLVRVGLETEICSRATWPTGGFIAGKEDGYGLFERSVQRLTRHGPAEESAGVTWTTFRAGETGILTGDLAVFILPARPITATFRARVEAYVKAGGKVLVLDSADNVDSTANVLLHPFHLSVRQPKTPPGPALTRAGSFPLIPVKHAFEVRGGVPLAHIGDTVVAATIPHGKGSVTVLGFASRFSDSEMGVTGDVVPDPELRKVYDFQFGLLRAIRKGTLLK